jgi:hypothetical protein
VGAARTALRTLEGTIGMGFLRKLFASGEDTALVVYRDIPMQTLRRGGNVRARGHQPSTVECPKCLARPGPPCAGLEKAVYHGPRVTAWKRQVLRTGKPGRS